MSMRPIPRMDGVRRVDFQVTFAMGFEEFVAVLASAYRDEDLDEVGNLTRKQLLDAVRGKLRRDGTDYFWTDHMEPEDIEALKDWAVSQVRRALPEIPEDEPDYRKLR